MSRPLSGVRARLARLDTPVTSYYLLLGSTLVLTAIGLVMVLSSSSVESYASSGSSFSVFLRQAMFAAIGLPAMWAASRVPPQAWRRLAWPALAGSVVLQLLVFSPLGYEVLGNRNWIRVGGFTAQPSEAAKVALCLWLGAVVAVKRPLMNRWKHALIPIVPGAGLSLGLVLLGHDLGTGLVLMLMIIAALFVSGVPLRWFAVTGLGVGVLAVGMVVTSANRLARLSTWFGGCAEQYLDSCWQPMHGRFALASGGVFGLGLGSSREKWSWLPEAHNDYIFAIIGEELGLLGTLAVLVLFTVLAWSMFRVMRRSQDLFVTVTTVAVIAWVIGQALINIGVVVGLLPVIGVPLPLISAGGSALVMTLIGIGIVLSFARHAPGAEETFAARPPVFARRRAPLAGAGR